MKTCGRDPLRWRTRIILPCLSIAIGTGCGSAETQTSTAIVRDSAGISIVENMAPSEDRSAGWLVSESPTMVLGGSGAGPTLFRVAGGLILPDGRVALANQGSGQILFFDSNGNFSNAHGRKGEGPGEYKRPVLVGALGGDTLVVADSENRRISFVHPVGGFLTSSRISTDLGPTVTARGMFWDGSVVVGGGYSWSSQSGETETSGYSRPNTVYRLANRSGELATDFGRFPGAEFNITVQELPGGDTSMSADLLPFAKHPAVAVGSNQFFVGTRDSWEIQVFDREGRLEKIWRMEREPQTVERRDVEALIQEELAEAGDPSAEPAIRRKYDGMPIPERMPAFSRLKVDQLGHLWVERYRRPGEVLPVFDVLDPAGEFVASVAIPEGNRILQVGKDFVLTLHQDEFDVETVRVYALTRS